MTDLIAFLTARLNEDEERARRVQAALDNGWNYFDETPTELIDPARVLREVAAKRAILAIHEPMPSMYGEPPVCSACWPAPQIATHPLWPCSTVRQMIAVYSDHPDYRQEWKS